MTLKCFGSIFRGNFGVYTIKIDILGIFLPHHKFVIRGDSWNF